MVWYVEAIWKKTPHLIDHGVTNPKAMAAKKEIMYSIESAPFSLILYTRTLYVMFLIKCTLHDRKIKKKGLKCQIWVVPWGQKEGEVPTESPHAAQLPEAMGWGVSSRGQVAVEPGEQCGNSTENPQW